MNEPQGPGAEVSALPESAEAEDAAPADPGLAAERDRLARTLRETRLQLAMTQARLAALEQSATMELGRTLVRAARRPWSRGVQLPADLDRLWRERGGLTGPGAATLALASAQLGDLAGGGERFLSALTAPGLGAPGAEAPGWTPPGLVITGVLTARACATLAPDAAVHPLLPHDADVMLESAGAAGELLARLVCGRRDEHGVLPVQRREAVPGHRSGHPDRSGPGIRGDRVQQGPQRRRLAGIPRAGVDRVARPGTGQPDRVEPGQLHAEPLVGHRVAAGGDPVEARCQVRGTFLMKITGLPSARAAAISRPSRRPRSVAAGSPA